MFFQLNSSLNASTNANQSVSDIVFQAISEAFGGNENPEGIKLRFYKAANQPRCTYLQNLNVEAGKTPTVSKFLDSCNRLLCNRCFRYDCLEHPFRTNSSPKIYPMAAPNRATKPCGDFCHMADSKERMNLPYYKPITVADKAIFKTFMTEGGDDNYTYCQLAFLVDRPCSVVFAAIQELLVVPEEIEAEAGKCNDWKRTATMTACKISSLTQNVS